MNGSGFIRPVNQLWAALENGQQNAEINLFVLYREFDATENATEMSENANVLFLILYLASIPLPFMAGVTK